MSKIAVTLLVSLLSITNLIAKEYNVGVYQNGPKIFMDEAGKPAGFFIDVLNEIAKQEGWTLHYIPCTWSECLDLTESGEIDIMPDVAYLPEREKRFNFGKEAVLASWSVIYRNKGVEIESILDLDGKKVAVLKNTVQSQSVKALIDDFHIEPSYKEVEDYATAFVLLENGQVDAVVSNRFYDPFKMHKSGEIVKTSIVIVPSTMQYAFSKKNKGLPEVMDRYLKSFKERKDSIYYKAMAYWLEPPQPINIPTWFYWIVPLALLAILILSILVVIFQKMVKKKSEELLQKEEVMIAQSRLAAMGEMIAMIAHQWRQPLSVIAMSNNNLELSLQLGEDLTKEAMEKHISTVNSQIDHLSKTIDDFRNFFKPKKLKESIPLSHMIEHVNKIIGDSLKNHNIKLIIENEQDYMISVYENEMLQVLLNLINNARDVLKEKQPIDPKIIIRSADTGCSILIEICDNGGGIPEKLLDKIGERYFTTKREKGTGLGLYMSKIIVQNHMGGVLEWYNRDGGACFTITLPK